MVKEISFEEVKKHRNRKSVWMVIHNDVYDVTNFLDEHPGGEDSLLDVAGKDASQAFEEVGHSADARELLHKYKIGTLPGQEAKKAACSKSYLSDTRSSRTEKKTWRTYDGSKPKSRSWSPKKSSGAPCAQKQEKRIQRIIVPRERRPPPPPPRNNLKWAIIALAGAIVIGFALKKYLS